MADLHRFFFAVRPSTEAGSMAIDAMRRQMMALGLSGGRVPKECLHVTLHWLGDYGDLPSEVLHRAKIAGSVVEMPPFGVGFDRLGSLHRGAGGLALTGSSELTSLRRFQRAVARAMATAGIDQHIRTSFKPHISLLYGEQYAVPVPISPIRWDVDELVLVQSLVGRSKHIDLARWPLWSRQMGFTDW